MSLVEVEVLHIGGRFQEVVREYLSDRAGEQVKALQLPDRLPLIVDDARDFIPEEAGSSAVVIAVNLHGDLLLELPHLMAERGGKALLVPQEDPFWVRPGLINQATAVCQAKGIECEFPKPFCHLQPRTPIIKQFAEQYQAGVPELEFEIEGGLIKEARVTRSAPCGLTCWMAPQLVGTEATEEAVVERAKVLHHSRPCFASMNLEPTINDTLMHLSLHLAEFAVAQAFKRAT